VGVIGRPIMRFTFGHERDAKHVVGHIQSAIEKVKLIESAPG
jgi:hypothetical protein